MNLWKVPVILKKYLPTNPKDDEKQDMIKILNSGIYWISNNLLIRHDLKKRSRLEAGIVARDYDWCSNFPGASSI